MSEEEDMSPGWRMYLEGQRQKHLPQKPEKPKGPPEPREATPEERALIEQLMKPPFQQVPTSSAPVGGGERTGGGWTWSVQRG